MKKRLVYFGIIFLALLLQLSVVPIFFQQQFLPDLVLMLALAWTIRDGFVDFLPWLVGMGIFYDLLTYEPIGVHVIILALSAYMVSFFAQRFTVHIRGVGFLLLMLFVLAAMLFARFFILLLEVLEGVNQISTPGQFLGQIGFSWFIFGVNVLLVLAGLWVIKWVKKYFFI